MHPVACYYARKHRKSTTEQAAKANFLEKVEFDIGLAMQALVRWRGEIPPGGGHPISKGSVVGNLTAHLGKARGSERVRKWVKTEKHIAYTHYPKVH